MELADGGTLAKYVEGHKCLSEEWARWYFQQLIVATDYCHNMVREMIWFSFRGKAVLGQQKDLNVL